MASRMDKYKNNSNLSMRSEKNKQLYRQIYNAYDEFENLIVPSNAKEIDLSTLKKEITSRDEYRKVRDYGNIAPPTSNNKVARKIEALEEQKKENEIYDINQLMEKAVQDNKKEDNQTLTMSSDRYLKKLKLDDARTNLDMIKDVYEDIRKETEEENETLLKTANLSLEILSDLKGDNDNTRIEAPIKEEFLPDSEKQFYSREYRFDRDKFSDKEEEQSISSTDEDDDFYDHELSEDGHGKFFFKILLLLFGISLVVVIAIYLFNYFHRG